MIIWDKFIREHRAEWKNHAMKEQVIKGTGESVIDIRGSRPLGIAEIPEEIVIMGEGEVVK